MQLCLDNENEMNARIYTFPGSMLKINDRKINYYDYINGPHHDGLDHALSQLVPLIKALDLESLVSDISFLSPLQRQFYISYLKKRRDLLFLH